MPRFRNIPTLYKKCIRIVCNIIMEYCTKLDQLKPGNEFSQLRELHEFLVANYPASVLDDLLKCHSKTRVPNSDSLEAFYFFCATVHKNIKRFEATNYNLDCSYWRILFGSFSNLVTLNLGLSCNDQILILISSHCPNLENLNAICKYERLNDEMNACTFVLPVTDHGLRHLCKCKKLRKLILNEPRSNNRGFQNSITYAGIRKLLIHITTLEDISYSNLGEVVCQGLQALSSLNLKVIRHYNATKESMQEIMRLCSQNLRELYLTFFSSDNHTDVCQEIINSKLQLHTFEVINLNFRTMFSDIFRSIGGSLISLSINNNLLTLSFCNLVTIGRFCPNLKFLACGEIVDRCEHVERPKNFGQFSKLESLYLSGYNMDIENVLLFCTENAENLENLRLMEHGLASINIDKILVDKFTPVKLRYIEMSTKISFSALGIRKIIAKFPLLNYLNVFCNDDCRGIIEEIMEMKYDLVFVNKMFQPV